MTPLTEKQVESYISALETITLNASDTLCADTSLNKHVQKILKDVDLSEVESYLKSNLKHSYKLLNTPHTKFALLVLYSVCENKYDPSYIYRILKVLAIIYYNVLLNKYLKYCNDVTMAKALQSVKGTNLFKKYGIEKSLDLLAKSVSKKVQERKDCELLFFIKKLYELRHRIAQSLKSVVAMYYKIYHEERSATSSSINYDRLVDSIVQKIIFYGYIKVPENCTRLYNNINDLVNIDETLLTNSIHEIIYLLGTNPTHQKILKNLHKLNYTKQVLRELGLELDVKTLYCYVATIYHTMKS